MLETLALLKSHFAKSDEGQMDVTPVCKGDECPKLLEDKELEVVFGL